jgi:hypothetical protein
MDASLRMRLVSAALFALSIASSFAMLVSR